MSLEQQDRVWVEFKAGRSISAVAREVDMPMQRVRRFLQQTGGIRPPARCRSPRHLTMQEREEISRGLALGESCRVIAGRLGRAPSSVSREIARNGGAAKYRALAADEAAFERGRRPKVSKLSMNAELRRVVEMQLGWDWSPQQISHRLVTDFPSDVSMRVSHETIYLELFTPARRAVRAQLVRALRSGRLMRYPKRASGSQIKPRIKNMVPITDRPEEVELRKIAGHWEGDLIMGKRPSAVITLVERTSRLVMLVALPDGMKAPAVRAALVAAFGRLPGSMVKSLTWDRGREMADHRGFTEQTGCPVFFCAARSPWQRGTNENTNGLLRQYLNKNGNISVHDQPELDGFADRLNSRPRAVLGWRTPNEIYLQMLAQAPASVRRAAAES
ncbi:IS30 family transposase [Variovorax sp. PBS-H4]|uniref:IS30 family transposase n=1 Tax=Variovorax sp. PBS-H4 TaxID=434008 RepID=UPI001E3793FF|nr:IS30 family transposase [Variovorax sp. PBS-H4]